MSPFVQYFSWLFDGDIKSGIPEEVSKASFISNKFIISCFLMNGKLNNYLNEYFNNMGLWALDRLELMLFLKKVVCDMKLGRNSVSYISNKKTKTEMIDVVEPHFPFLKKYEISDIVEKIETADDKDSIYESLGLNKYKKDKTKKKAEPAKKEKKKQTVIEFLNANFRLEN